jgi:hypothetical protein
MDKKPFKETKLGKFLAEKAPRVLDVVGDALPEKGVLGIVKNLIDREPDLTAEQRAEALAKVQEFEKEFFALEIDDRKSARAAEIERLKAGSKNLTQNVLSYLGVTAFFAMVGYILSHGLGHMTTEESFIIGNLTGLAGAIAKDIYGYYFGSSIGSRNKEILMGENKRP